MITSNKEETRIFIGLIEIAGYYSNLKKGFDELGILSTFVNLKESPYEYKNQKDNLLIKFYRLVQKIRLSTPDSKPFKRIILKISQKILLLIIFCWAIFKFDVFIFGFGKSFFSLGDLPILKFLGKMIIFVFNGSDARPHYLGKMSKKWKRKSSVSESESATMAKRKKEKISKIERYADVIVSQPFISYFFEKPIVNWLSIGIPYPAPEKRDHMPLKDGQYPIRILHSPSSPKEKGTPLIRTAISNLKRKGFRIDYVEIIGKPNEEVLRNIRSSDFVIDQLYSDIPMAAFATEASSFGIPTIIGGYGWEKVESLFPKDRIPPSKRCHPDDIESTIEQFILDRKGRIELGQEAKDFVLTYWNPKKVAERYCRLINGDIPEDWLFNPQDITYLHGAGLSEQNCKRNIQALLENSGIKALQLCDKPKLEKMLVEFAML